jgi:hypothetical protein
LPHKTRSVFERYHIVDERDLHDAADRLYRHLNGKTNAHDNADHDGEARRTNQFGLREPFQVSPWQSERS